MNINSFFDMFLNHGWEGVLAITVIGIIYLCIVWANKKLTASISKDFKDFSSDLSKTITDQNDKLLTGIQEQNKLMLNHILSDNKTDHDNKIEKRLTVENDINEKLKEMVYAYDADRTAVIEFHNSKENLDGLSFCWYDIHYEKFSKGTDDIIMKVQNQPSSILSPIVKRLKGNDYVLLSKQNLDELFDEICSLYNQLNRIPNLEYIAYFGIYNKDNKLVGFVVTEWHNNKIEQSEVEEYCEDILHDVQYISSLLILNQKIAKEK